MQIDYKKRFESYICYFTGGKRAGHGVVSDPYAADKRNPRALDCKIGKMDDKTLFYYEVTSRQSLQSVF